MAKKKQEFKPDPKRVKELVEKVFQLSEWKSNASEEFFTKLHVIEAREVAMKAFEQAEMFEEALAQAKTLLAQTEDLPNLRHQRQTSDDLLDNAVTSLQNYVNGVCDK